MTGPCSVPVPPPASWRQEIRATLALSGPLVLINLAQIGMGTTDVMMMGGLGPDTLAAGALGVNLWFIALIFGIGLLSAVSPMIARDLGRDPDATEAVRATVWQGLWSAACLAPPCWLVLWWSEPLLLALGQAPDLAAQAGVYVRVLQWALLPSWGFLVLRGFVSALERPVWSMVIGLGAVAVNAAANWCLMLGQCGFRPLGIAGSGLATLLSSLLMFLALGLVTHRAAPFRRFRLLSGPWRPDGPRLRAFWRLGLPMAAMLSFEVTMFNAAVFLMGLLGAASLAAHSIAIQLASLTFMVPLGLAQAVAVRVGRARGAGDKEAARLAGWTALGLAVSFMGLMSLTMILAPRRLISAFLDTADPANAPVIALATSFLMLAALFQIADGAQAVGAGMLRGLHDARVPMLFALTGYWGIGLPLGIVLAFPAGMGGTGIWLGLAAGLMVVAALMLWRWTRREALGLLTRP